MTDIIGGPVSRGLRPVFALLAALFLSACVLQTAPSHDASLVRGLSEANSEALQLFAAVENGASAGTFSARRARYEAVIGRFAALQVEAAARSVPKSAVSGVVSRAAAASAIDGDPANPTPSIVENILLTLKRMRDVDRQRGLSPGLVTGFRNSYVERITEVFVIEKALERR